MTDDLDRALTVLGEQGPSYGGGLANHGPMVVETLEFLGVCDAIEPWVEWYRPRLEPLAGAGPAYLRNYERMGQEIETTGWETVVRRRLPRLLGDCAAGSAGHGLLRVAHAIRALTVADTSARRRELAHGLAYWQLTWRRLPGRRPDPTGVLPAAEALAALPRPDVVTGGFFTTVLPAVATSSGFADAVDALAAPADVALALSDLTVAAARAFLANGERNAIALVHAVTIPAALRTLLPFLDDAERATAFGAVWQTVAAMVAGYGAGLALTRARQPAAWTDVVASSIAARDDHAIKLAGACVAEHDAKPSAVFAAAAELGAEVLAVPVASGPERAR